MADTQLRIEAMRALLVSFFENNGIFKGDFQPINITTIPTAIQKDRKRIVLSLTIPQLTNHNYAEAATLVIIDALPRSEVGDKIDADISNTMKLYAKEETTVIKEWSEMTEASFNAALREVFPEQAAPPAKAADVKASSETKSLLQWLKELWAQLRRHG